jgi:polyadenylate-binding protein
MNKLDDNSDEDDDEDISGYEEKENKEENEEIEYCNLFIKNLAKSVNDMKLRNKFSPYGEICSAKVITNTHTNQSCGYGIYSSNFFIDLGFVKFKNRINAERAMVELNKTKFENKKIKIKFAKYSNTKINESLPQTNIYIRPLTCDVTTKTLEQLFGKFGPIESCKFA